MCEEPKLLQLRVASWWGEQIEAFGLCIDSEQPFWVQLPFASRPRAINHVLNPLSDHVCVCDGETIIPDWIFEWTSGLC